MGYWTGVLTFTLGLSLPTFAQEIKSVTIGQGPTITEEDFVKYFAQNANDNGALSVSTKSAPNAQAILSHTPKGVFEAPVDPECSVHELEKLTLHSGMSAMSFAKAAKAYFAKCEKNLTYRSTKGLLGLLEFSMTEYHFLQNNKIKPITFKYEDGTETYGFIGLKDKTTTRPWIIAKCGVFCSAGESASVNSYMIHLFDESPFNIIFLGNRSGTDYIKGNKKLLIGGYLESHDYFEISRWLVEKSGLQNTVDSIHALGISLAGNASTYASVLEKYYPTPRRTHYIDSTISVCPVINLHSTLKDMYANSIKGEIFVRYTWSELKKVKDDLPEFAHYLQKAQRPNKEEFPQMMGDMISYYGGQWTKNSGNSRNGPQINSIQDIWDLNQFTQQTQVDIPLLVWASKDDSIVNNEINTQNLENSYVGKNSTNIGIINLNFGNHCGFSTVYGYPVSTTLLRNWVLNHSHEFGYKRKARTAIVDLALSDAPRGTMYTRVWAQAIKGADYVKINAEYYNGSRGDQSCDDKSPFMNPTTCYATKTSNVPLSEFGFLNLQTPNSETEAQVLTRKINSTLQFLNKNKLAVEGGRRAPNAVQWFSYY